MTHQQQQPQWYVAHGASPDGPFTEDAVRQMIAAGQVTPSDRVWRDGMPAWITADQIPGWFAPGTIPPPVPVSYHAPMASNDIGQNAGTRMLIPVGRSGWAIAAGYLGLFSVLGCAGPFAIVCAVLALREMKRDPSKHGAGRAWFGLIMGIIGTAMLILFAVLAGMK